MEKEQTNNNICADKVPWLQLFRQVNVSLTMWCFYFLTGVSIGSPTVIVPQLIRETNETIVKEDQLYPWITSIGSYAGVLGIFTLTLISHLLGRKKVVFLIAISSFSASVLLYFSRNPTHIFLSQLMFSVPMAAQTTVYTIVLAEYSSTKYRGIFLTLKSASFFWGVWIANAIGIFTHFKYIGLLSAICSCYCFTNAFFMTESPYWLASKEKYDDCIETHRWLKGESDNAEKELQDLIYLQRELRIKERKTQSVQNNVMYYVKLVQLPEIYKPCLLAVLVFLVYHISGKLVCAVYAIEIMKEITDSESTAHIGVLVLDGFSVLGMYIGCGVSKYLKRRTMLLVTATIGTKFLLILSLYLYLIKLNIILGNSYVIITLLSVYSIAICCGPAIMATSICGELIPVTARSFCVVCIGILTILIYGTLVKCTPYMFVAFDIHGTFLFYGLSSAICIILAYRYLPETKDKSLYEISEYFKYNDASKHGAKSG